VRAGVVNVCLVGEPLRGWRQGRVSEPRTRLDWAAGVKDVVDVYSPDAERIVLVMAHLTTHAPASLDAAVAPAAAKRIAATLESHSTPKHGSWLNLAERELSRLQRQWRDRRRDDRVSMARAVGAWVAARTAAGQAIAWRFTTADARIKLKRLYPAFHE
jgi:DDE superfamily endonuclease